MGAGACVMCHPPPCMVTLAHWNETRLPHTPCLRRPTSPCSRPPQPCHVRHLAARRCQRAYEAHADFIVGNCHCVFGLGTDVLPYLTPNSPRPGHECMGPLCADALCLRWPPRQLIIYHTFPRGLQRNLAFPTLLTPYFATPFVSRKYEVIYIGNFKDEYCDILAKNASYIIEGYVR